MGIDIGGNRLFYRKSGSGEPIVLHGFPTSSYDWRKVIHQLSNIGTVIAPDLYGFGYSGPPKGEDPAAAKPRGSSSVSLQDGPHEHNRLS